MYKLGADVMVSFLEIINKFEEDKQKLYRIVYDSMSNSDSHKEISEKTGKTIEEVKEVISDIKHFLGRVLTKDTNFNILNTLKRFESDPTWGAYYVYVDIHSTVLEPDYGGLAKKYYPHAEKTLKMLSDRSDVELVLYTCSYTNEIAQYLDFFEDSGITFDGVNRVPVKNTRGGDFTDKPYFNILLEDKAGFVGKNDWYVIDQIFGEHPAPEAETETEPKED